MSPAGGLTIYTDCLGGGVTVFAGEASDHLCKGEDAEDAKGR